jgi:hypothetical protein
MYWRSVKTFVLFGLNRFHNGSSKIEFPYCDFLLTFPFRDWQVKKDAAFAPRQRPSSWRVSPFNQGITRFENFRGSQPQRAVFNPNFAMALLIASLF